MAFDATVVRVLVASPADTAEERDRTERVIGNWNATWCSLWRTVLIPVRWETWVHPEMGDRPQALINRQIVDDADILVGIFWTRLGSPTGAARSGTVEEITRFRSLGKPVLLFHSQRPQQPDRIDNEQLLTLRAFIQECKRDGIVSTYATLEEFADILQHGLSSVVVKNYSMPAGSDGMISTAPVSRSEHEAPLECTIVSEIVSRSESTGGSIVRRSVYYLEIRNRLPMLVSSVRWTPIAGDGSFLRLAWRSPIVAIPTGEAHRLPLPVLPKNGETVTVNLEWLDETGVRGGATAIIG